VIAVVGMNPNKKYLVSPEERVELIQSMLITNPKLKNVRAEGKDIIRFVLRAITSLLN
jgi:phosphopantetheine adenylyltransferase